MNETVADEKDDEKDDEDEEEDEDEGEPKDEETKDEACTCGIRLILLLLPELHVIVNTCFMKIFFCAVFYLHTQGILFAIQHTVVWLQAQITIKLNFCAMFYFSVYAR